jgi:signal transduction histidine kinase
MTETGRSELNESRRALLVVAGMAFTAFLILLFAQRLYSEREDLATNVAAQAAIIGANASAAVVFNDGRTALEILTALRKSPIVLEAAIYRTDGGLLSAYVAPGQSGRLLPDARPPAAGTEYTWREVVISTPIILNNSEVGRIVIRASQDMLYGELTNYLLALLVTTMIAGTLAFLATGRLRRRMSLARNQLETSRTMLQQLQMRRETLLEEEHRRIAIEIHDQLGQVLTAALLNLRLLERNAGQLGDGERSLLRDVENQLNEAYKGMKDIAATLHPVVLQFGLTTAIEWLGERILRPAGIALEIAEADPAPLDPVRSLALFRIAQESFSNTVRHAAATAVRVSLHQDAEHLVFEISDDGAGFAAANGREKLHFGLLGIRQRVLSIGARADIESAPGSGTSIRVTMKPAAPTGDAEGEET